MKIFVISLFLASSALVSAQISVERSVVGSLGQSFSNTDLQLSATVGEAVVTTVESGDLFLTQGFQQSEPEDLTAVRLLTATLTELTAFPNPTAGPLTVRLVSPASRNLRLSIYNALGQAVGERAVLLVASTPATVPLNLTAQPAGVYHLRLTTTSGETVATARILSGDR